MLLVFSFFLFHVCRSRSLTLSLSSHNAVINSTVTHHRFNPTLRQVDALFQKRWSCCKINSIPIHQRIMTSNDLSWCGSCLLYRLVFAFHYLHYFAEEFLVLVIDVSFPIDIGFSANCFEVGKFLWAGLVDSLLHVRNGVYKILVLLSLDQNAWHIPLVVDSVFLFWKHLFMDYFKFENIFEQL